MITPSNESIREKLAPSSPSIQNLPYDEDETEYQNCTQNLSGAPHENDLPDEHESFHEYESRHKPHLTPFYRRRRVWKFCGIATVIFLAIFIPILIKFIIPAIAQMMMNNAEMKVVQLNMTDPGETSMTVSVLASVGGIPKLFSTSMEFTEAVVVSWNGIEIGSMTLGTVHVSKGKGDILQTTTFKILNTQAFGDFAKVMVRISSLIFGPRSMNSLDKGGSFDVNFGSVSIHFDHGCCLCFSLSPAKCIHMPNASNVEEYAFFLFLHIFSDTSPQVVFCEGPSTPSLVCLVQ